MAGEPKFLSQITKFKFKEVRKMFIIIFFLFLLLIEEIPAFVSLVGVIGGSFSTVWAMKKTRKLHQSLPEEIQGILRGCVFMSPIIVFLDPDLRKSIF